MYAPWDLAHRSFQSDVTGRIPFELNGVLLLSSRADEASLQPVHALRVGGGQALWYPRVASASVPGKQPTCMVTGDWMTRLSVRRSSPHALDWHLLGAREETLESGTLAVEQALEVRAVVLSGEIFVLIALESARSEGLEQRPGTTVLGLAPRRPRARVRWLAEKVRGYPDLVDACTTQQRVHLDLGLRDRIDAADSRVTRLSIDLPSSSVESRFGDECSLRFPRLLPESFDRLGRYMVGIAAAEDSTHGPSLVLVDRSNGKRARHTIGFGREIAPPLFAPRLTRHASNAGFVLASVYDAVSDRTDCIVLDLERFDAPPAASIRLPVRPLPQVRARWVDLAEP